MKSIQEQRGGFVLGLIVGLLLGLAVALGVALYVTKVPVPLMNKMPPHTPEQDAAEAQKNKTWDPNAVLAGKPVPRPQMAQPASAPAAEPGAASDPRPTPLAEGQRPPPILPPPAHADVVPAGHAASGTDTAAARRDPGAILNGGTVVPPAASPAAPPARDAYTYWVQVGAYSRPEDAEQQRARLALDGQRASVSEREQNGRSVHRVRLGPFDTREEAEAQRQRIAGSQPEASLVRVERGAP